MALVEQVCDRVAFIAAGGLALVLVGLVGPVLVSGELVCSGLVACGAHGGVGPVAVAIVEALLLVAAQRVATTVIGVRSLGVRVAVDLSDHRIVLQRLARRYLSLDLRPRHLLPFAFGFTVYSRTQRQQWASPWVLAGLPTLLSGAPALAVMGSLIAVLPLADDGGPSPLWSSIIHLALLIATVPGICSCSNDCLRHGIWILDELR